MVDLLSDGAKSGHFVSTLWYASEKSDDHILNKWRKACPIGVRGEIYIGGDGVAACYYGDKEKTDASFVEHPQYGRLYKTGDYGKLREEGFVEFLGRSRQPGENPRIPN
ncbi:MAG: hypothetical protein V8Q79_01605 [Christensenellales bacterium]